MITVDLSKERNVVMVDLSKKEEKSLENIKINLKWSNRVKENTGILSRIFGNSQKDVDLDLGCLFELKNGKKGTVQALGNSFGSLNSQPYIELDKDDRNGDSEDGEWLTINAEFWNNIKRVLVFAYIYDGASNWNDTDGAVDIYVNDEVIHVDMRDENNKENMCGIVLLENEDGKIKTSRVVKYFSGHEQLDRAFDWNMRWVVGTK